MSRTVLAVVVAVVITALTAVAFFVTSTQVDDRVRKAAEEQLKRAPQVVQKLAELEAIDIQNKAERLAADRSLVAAISSESGAERESKAALAFSRFASSEKEDVKPDIIALVDQSGNVIAMNVPGTVATQWKKDPQKADSKSVIPALDLVLGPKKVIISDIWEYKDQMMKIGVAPIVDPKAPTSATDPESTSIIGAVVVAYAQTAQEAQKDRAVLGTDIAYFDGTNVVASSFTRGTSEEDTGRRKQLDDLVKQNPALAQPSNNAQRVTLDGVDYLVAAMPLPRKATKRVEDLDPKYPKITAGAMVLAAVNDANGSTWFIKLAVVLVGGGGLAIALLGMFLTHRRVVAQVDVVELGVIDIINGNVDRTFRPVGEELDGLSNGLNVMLARLLGKPEPGEEEFDEEGNPIVQGRVDFEEAEQGASPDPELAALAQESEPDYYKRVFTEYLAARKESGNPDEVSFENFIAKLKVNEGKLKAQYQCRAVRFRVVMKDGKVTLKPVPIFA